MACKSCSPYEDVCQGRCDMDTQGLPLGLKADRVLVFSRRPKHRRGVVLFVREGYPLVYLNGKLTPPYGEHIPEEIKRAYCEWIEEVYLKED